MCFNLILEMCVNIVALMDIPGIKESFDEIGLKSCGFIARTGEHLHKVVYTVESGIWVIM